MKSRFVIVDRNPGVLEDFSMPHGIALSGDATDDAVLKQAGLGRARALVSTAASDADNLYIVMSAHLELQIEEIGVHAGSTLVGQSVKESPVKSELGIIIVAIKKPDGKMQYNPTPETVLDAGDMLITLGHRQQLDRLEAMAGGGR